MKDLNQDNFGLLIAFLLPGFIFLWGLSLTFPEVATWLAATSGEHASTVGGFLYSTLASLALGLLISGVRWRFIDLLMRWTGVHGKGLTYEKLKDADTLATYKEIIANHYRYYQYYANSLVAVIGAFAVYAVKQHWKNPTSLYVALGILVVVLFMASRDALSSMYAKLRDILK
ncbi:MAG TPA: hypothetical protein VNX02_17115 [Steroidobacteraceae bacterium]|jgi:hypothetical protein|nr:hypothetical protein [Steroidobacteraceae bacterium]